MNELALFAGTGGGLLASQWLLGFSTLCYVETDQYCVDVIKARIAEGYLHDAPIWDDVKTFDGRPWRGAVDLLTAGFPCQPFSVAGKRRGKDDDRNLWPETIRVIREVRPQYAFLENVPGLLAGHHGYFGQILGELAESGYDARWCVLSAADVGAPHLRKRLWVLAYARCRDAQECGLPIPKATCRTYPGIGRSSDSGTASGSGSESEAVADTGNQRSPCTGTESQPASKVIFPFDSGAEDAPEVADTQGTRENAAEQSGQGSGVIEGGDSVPYAPRDEGRRIQQQRISPDTTSSNHGGAETSWWATEPELGRVVDGVAHRVDRLRAIGNGQVPEVARRAWETLTVELTNPKP